MYNLFTYIWVVLGVNVGKYISPIEHLGMYLYIYVIRRQIICFLVFRPALSSNKHPQDSFKELPPRACRFGSLFLVTHGPHLKFYFDHKVRLLTFGCFQKRGGPPKWMVKIMVPNPMNKWMIWGGLPPLFLETPIY